jgi:hypothetical protein
MSVSFTQIQQTMQNVSRALTGEIVQVKGELQRIKILFLQLAANQQAILDTLKANNIEVKINSVVEAADDNAASKTP